LKLISATEANDYRTVLEDGNILLFPDGGFEISPEIKQNLMGATQDARSFHKNIAYKVHKDEISGLVNQADAEFVRPAMREYSRRALDFMRRILPEYASDWILDYASFRSIEERGRNLPLTKRNDLLHIDAFPTRPVFGDLILRCFTNVHPEHNREWLTSDPFADLATREALCGFSPVCFHPGETGCRASAPKCRSSPGRQIPL
jgi:3-deoxy-D-manno-oct-2-ulosonic acid (Kdo) hydroxylase